MGKILWVVDIGRIIPWDPPKFRIWGTKTVDLERVAYETEVKPGVSCCPRNQVKKMCIKGEGMVTESNANRSS